MGESVSIREVRWNDRTGELYLFDSLGRRLLPRTATVGLGYSRGQDRAPKVVSEAPLRSTTTWHPDPDFEVFSNHDIVIAIDTNTSTTTDGSIAVACTVLAHRLRTQLTRGFGLSWRVTHALEYRGVPVHNERVAWAEVIYLLLQDRRFPRSNRVALVVDSHLRDLPDIDNRRLPLIEEFYLPPNFQLIYGSSELAADTYINLMIAAADRESRRLMDWIRATGDSNGLRPARESSYYTAIRKWDRVEGGSVLPDNAGVGWRHWSG